MNERIYVEGLVRKQTPLLSIFGVSNEWSPEGCEAALAAFFDRFLFRKLVNPIRGRDGKKALLTKAVAGDNCRPKYSGYLTLEELENAQAAAADLSWSNDAKKALWEILEGLTKEGVNPGDRRQYQSVNATRAYAYLQGSVEVLPEHLEILQHVLWVDPIEQPKIVAKIVQQVANPIGMLVNSKLIEVEDVLLKCKPTEAVPKLQSLQKELQGLKKDPRVEKALMYVGDCIADSYNAVLGRRVVDVKGGE